MQPSLFSRVAATFAAAALVPLAACGGCPASRYSPAVDAHDETYSYKLTFNDDGSRVVGVFDASSERSIPCDTKCASVVSDRAKSCEDACGALLPYDQITSCSFGPLRGGLTCHVHYAAQGESCSCSMYDC